MTSGGTITSAMQLAGQATPLPPATIPAVIPATIPLLIVSYSSHTSYSTIAAIRLLISSHSRYYSTVAILQ